MRSRSVRGPAMVATTLIATRSQSSAPISDAIKNRRHLRSIDLKLGKENFVVASIVLSPNESPAVTMVVMKSYDQASAFLDRLSRLLLAVGFGAVMLG